MSCCCYCLSAPARRPALRHAPALQHALARTGGTPAAAADSSTNSLTAMHGRLVSWARCRRPGCSCCQFRGRLVAGTNCAHAVDAQLTAEAAPMLLMRSSQQNWRRSLQATAGQLTHAISSALCVAADAAHHHARPQQTAALHVQGGRARAQGYAGVSLGHTRCLAVALGPQRARIRVTLRALLPPS